MNTAEAIVYGAVALLFAALVFFANDRAGQREIERLRIERACPAPHPSAGGGRT